MTFIMPKIVITHTGDEIDTSSVNNREIRNYLSSLNSVELEGMPGWIEDIISGATSQVGGSARIGRGRLFGMLLALDEITPATVAQLMNRKRQALGEAPYGDRHCRKVAAALRCASNGIKHHRAKYDPKPVSDNAPSFQPSPLPYSDDEMRELKRRSISGPFSELQKYESALKAKYTKEI